MAELTSTLASFVFLPTNTRIEVNLITDLKDETTTYKVTTTEDYAIRNATYHPSTQEAFIEFRRLIDILLTENVKFHIYQF